MECADGTEMHDKCDFGCGDIGTHFCFEWDAWSCNDCCDLQNAEISFPECPRFANEEEE